MLLITLLSSSNNLVYNVEIAKALSPQAAIILGLLCDEYRKWRESNMLEDDAFFCTSNTIFDRSGVTEDAQRTAIKKLVDAKIIEIVKKGMPAKNFYKFNLNALSDVITTAATVRQNAQTCSANPHINIYNNKQSSIIPKPIPSSNNKFVKPSITDIQIYCQERKNAVNPERFFNYYETNGWKQSNNRPIVDWKACVRTWENNTEDWKKEKQQNRPGLHVEAKPLTYAQTHIDKTRTF